MTTQQRIKLFSELVNKYSEKFPVSDDQYNMLIDTIKYWEDGKVSTSWLYHEMDSMLGVIQSNPFYKIEPVYEDLLPSLTI